MKRNRNLLTKFKIIFGLMLSGMLLILACEYQPYSQGKVLYDFHCANCHMQDGSGLRGLIPPLANADYLKDLQADLACIMRYGLKGEIMVNGKNMTPKWLVYLL